MTKRAYYKVTFLVALNDHTWHEYIRHIPWEELDPGSISAAAVDWLTDKYEEEGKADGNIAFIGVLAYTYKSGF